MDSAENALEIRQNLVNLLKFHNDSKKELKEIGVLFC